MTKPIYECPLHDSPVRFPSERQAREHILSEHSARDKLQYIYENELVDFGADKRLKAFSEINDATNTHMRVDLIVQTDHPQTTYARRRKLSNGQYDPPKTLRLTITGNGQMEVDVLESEGLSMTSASGMNYQIVEEPMGSSNQPSTNNPHDPSHPLYGEFNE